MKFNMKELTKRLNFSNFMVSYYDKVMKRISLEAIQTPDSQTLESRDTNLVDWYPQVLDSIKGKLQRVSRHVAADAYFSKNTFVEGLHGMGFALMSRFRNDAVLFYPTPQNLQARRVGQTL
ncbi:hypothetical protein [uncultured Proteiniphilum sp.]|uniref:hypothetical protein n=1 Tax=uncultured Proteiniphilum sp. TaxID=497637 RepID=UPI0026346395|nr:hypothetical protein [uncultured Proteiniphilum sp.]